MLHPRTFVSLGFALLLFSFNAFAVDYYWVGNGGSWTDLTHWATTSGGATKHTVLPTANDDVYFDANSFSSASQTVTITFGAKCRSMNWTGVTNTPKIYSFFDDLEVYGSLTIPATVTREFFGNIRMKATSGTHTIDLANLPLSGPNNETLFIEGVGGTWNLASGLTIYRLDLKGGTLNTNGQSVTVSSMSSSGTNTRSYVLGNSAISCATWDIQNATGMTVNAGTSTITTTFRFNGKGFTYNNLTISGTVDVYDNNTFNTITLEAGSILKLKEGTTQTISGLTSNGTAGNPVTIKSVTDGVAATLSKNSGSVSISNARIQDNTATGGATFSAPTGSVDLGNTLGWNITPIQPTVQVTSAQFSKVLTTSVVLRWTNGNGAKRIVLAKVSSAVNADPVDNVAYTAGAFGAGTQIGTGNYVVYAGNSDRATITGLTAGSTYFFKVYEFNSNNTNTLIDYLITTPASATTAMLAANAVVISNTPVTTCAGKFYDTGGGSLYNYSNNESFTQTLTPATAGNKIRLTFTDFFTAGAGDVLSIYDGADVNAPLIGSFSESTAPTTITATNAAGKLTVKFVSDANIGSTGWVADISCITLDTEPTVAATAPSFTNVSGSSLRLNWTKGNGTRRIVLARASSAVNFTPVDGTEYVANAGFASGTQLGTGNYVVYNGTGNFADVTNLSINTTYHFSIYEYNGANTSSNYRGTGTTANQTTPSVAAEPTTPAAAIVVTSRSENALSFSWTNGNGVRRLVVAKAGGPVDAVPVDGVLYSPTGSFTNGPSLGNGNVIVYSGSVNSAFVSDLSALTTYHFAVYEFNGTSNGVTNYLTNTPPIASFKTLAAPPMQTSTASVSNITFNTMDVSWNAAGAEKYLVVMNLNNSTPTINDGIEYVGNAVLGSGSKVGADSYVVFAGGGTSVNVTGLQADVQYSIRIYGYNGTGADVNYNFGGPTSFTSTLRQAPTVPASNLIVTNVGPDSVKLSWTRGNGDRVILVARAGAPVGTNFRDSTFVTANDGHFGRGTDLGEGTVVYSGIGTSAVGKGLAPNTTYYFAVFEYNYPFISKDNRYYNFFLKTNAPVASAATTAGRNFYWVGGTGKWTDLSHWATSSGGSTKHTSLPVSSDNVYFDAASFTKDTDTVYFDRPLFCKDMDWSTITKKASFVSITAPGSSSCWNDLFVYGSLRLSNLMKINFASIFFRATTKNNVIDLAGNTRFGNSCNNSVQFYGYNGEWTVSPGELNLGYFQMYAGKVIASASTWRFDRVEFNPYNNTKAELVLGQSKITTSLWMKGSNVSVSGGTIILNGSARFETSGANYRKVLLQGQIGAGVEISGGGAIDSLAVDPGREVRFEAGKIFNIGKLIANGDSTKTTTLRSTILGAPFTFSKSTGEVSVNYVIIKDNNAIGGAQFNAKNSVNGGNVSGWTFTIPPVYTPKKSASLIVFRRVFRNELKMKWGRGDGLKRIVVMKEITAVDKLPAAGTTYTANAIFGQGSDLGNGNFVVYNGDGDSTSVVGLTPGKKYHVAIFEFNQWGNGVKYKATAYPTSTITMVGPSDVIMSNSPVSVCNAKFFDEGGRGFYTKFLSLAQTITPQTPGTKLGVLFTSFAPVSFDSLIVYDGNSTSAAVLAKYTTFGSNPSYLPGTAVVATNPSGALTFLLKARDSTADEDQHVGWEADLFCVGTLASQPSSQATSLVVTASNDLPQLTVKMTKGDGVGRLIIAREGSAVNKSPSDGFFPTANNLFGSGHALGDGNFVVYAGAEDQVTVTGLRSNTKYHFAVFEYNGGEGSINYLTTNPAIGNGTTAIAAPTQPSSNIYFTDVYPNGMTVNFTTGDGTSRIMVMRKWRDIDFVPVDGTAYSGNPQFAVGQKVADSTYVVLRTEGGGPLQVTNLEPATRYYVKIFEYNAQGSVVKYGTLSAATGSRVTLTPLVTMAKITSTYCPNEQVTAKFRSTGRYRDGNKFTLQLSDSLGGFANPLKLRDTTITSTYATIVAKIPNNVKGSLLYKMRIVTSNPVTVSDSIRSLSIIQVPNVSVEVAGETFESSSATNNQWLRDGAVIPGATNRTFTPTTDGSYSVKVTVGSCFKVSDPVIFTGLEGKTSSAIEVYPNPFTDQLVIESKNTGKFYIIDAIGREWVRGELDAQVKMIDTKHIPAGVLLVRVQDASGITIRKVVKQ